MQNSTLCKLDKSSAKNMINEILPIPASSSFTDEEDLLNSLHSLLVRCFQLQLCLPLLLSSFQDLLDLSGLQPLNDRILSFLFFFFSFREDEYRIIKQKPLEILDAFFIFTLTCNGYMLHQPLNNHSPPSLQMCFTFRSISRLQRFLVCVIKNQFDQECEWALDWATYEHSYIYTLQESDCPISKILLIIMTVCILY